MVNNNSILRSKLLKGLQFVRTWMNVGVVINSQLAFGQVQFRKSLSLKNKDSVLTCNFYPECDKQPSPLCTIHVLYQLHTGLAICFRIYISQWQVKVLQQKKYQRPKNVFV